MPPQPSALTPQLIASFNKISGLNVPATAASAPAASQSRADEIRTLGQQATIKKQATTPVTEQTSASAEDPTQTLGADDAKEVLAGAEDAADAASTAQQRAAQHQIIPGSGTSITDAAKAEADKTGDVLEAIPGVLAGGIRSVFAPLTATIQKLSQTASDNPEVQKFAMSSPVSALLDSVNNAEHPLNQWAAANPRAAKDLQNVLTIALTAAGGAETDPLLNADLGETATGLKNTATDAIGKPPGPDGGGGSGIRGAFGSMQDLFSSKNVPETATAITKPGSGGVMDSVRAFLAKESADPRLLTSASRLDNPLDTYSKMADQAKSSLTDVKEDDPLAAEGTHLGNAYGDVINLRRSVGKVMGQELDKIKDTGVPNFKDPIKQVTNEITDPKTGQLKGIGKMTSFDREQMGTYVKELAALGKNPTVGQLDDFLGRVPQELDVAKADKNITNTTNAERIIKGSLSTLRDTINPDKGAPESFRPYNDARQQYANLSNFLDEGSSYLGKKTQSGDYARDVSLQKSAAESLVSGGKKDWLMKLEAITGYPALDRIVLGIQAMKDTGDLRGLSLFKALTKEGGIPTPHGVVGQLVKYGVDKGADVTIGSPVEKTKALLRTLSSRAEETEKQ